MSTRLPGSGGSGATAGATACTRVGSAERVLVAGAHSPAAGSGSGGSGIRHTRMEDEKQLENVYELGDKLGQGTFGLVRRVVHKETGETWACKVVNKEKAGSSAIKLLEREVSILKNVQHEHIIRLKEVFETSKKMYLVMELCEDGELADVLKKRLTFSEQDTLLIMSRMVRAIAYLHKNDMVHRDLKLENILLSQNPNDSSDKLYIKVTDFGLSVVKDGAGHDNMLMDFCGTPMYMAPEIIDNKTYSERCDIWAMGVIMYVLICGVAPFIGKDEENLYQIIKTADIKKNYLTVPIWKKISDEAKDCLSGMLAVDPAHRLTAHEILDHPWITGSKMGDAKPRLNVLEMMKEWREDLANDNEDGVLVNGQSSTCSSISDSSSNQKESKSRRTSLPSVYPSSSKKSATPSPKNSSPNKKLSSKNSQDRVFVTRSNVSSKSTFSQTSVQTKPSPTCVLTTGRLSKPNQSNRPNTYRPSSPHSTVPSKSNAISCNARPANGLTSRPATDRPQNLKKKS